MRDEGDRGEASSDSGWSGGSISELRERRKVRDGSGEEGGHHWVMEEADVHFKEKKAAGFLNLILPAALWHYLISG